MTNVKKIAEFIDWATHQLESKKNLAELTKDENEDQEIIQELIEGIEENIPFENFDKVEVYDSIFIKVTSEVQEFLYDINFYQAGIPSFELLNEKSY